MQKLSSFATPIVQWAAPVIALGCSAAMFVGAAIPEYERTAPDILLRLAAVGVGIMFLFEARTAWRLADEAYDDGDALIVRRKNIEVRIPLTDIIGFESGLSIIYFNRAIIALTLREETPLGRKIVFLSYYLWLHQLQTNPIADDLYKRCEKARERERAGRTPAD